MFHEETIRDIIESLGVDVDSETGNDFLIYCPFHHNVTTPSMTVSKVEGVYFCHNPDCSAAGSIYRLVAELANLNEFEASRFVEERKVPISTEEAVNKIMLRKEEKTFDTAVLERLQEQLEKSMEAREYLKSRGISWETASRFGLGFSSKTNMVVMPVYSPRDVLLGLVGRSIEGKAYKNSKGGEFSKTLYNIQNAKRSGDTCVITEGSFDAMKVSEAGFPCVVATLGGHLSLKQKEILDTYFNRILIMTDADGPGRQLGKKIMYGLPNKIVKWVVHPDWNEGVYGGAKDAGDMSLEDIEASIKNAMTPLEVKYTLGVKL